MVDVALRLLTYGGTLWLFGLPVVARLVLYPGFRALPEGSWRVGKSLVLRSLARTTWVALGAVAVGALGLIIGQAMVFADLQPGLGLPAAVTTALTERFGAVTALRVVLVLALAVVLTGQLQQRLLAGTAGVAGKVFWLAWVALATGLVVTLPVTGHAGVAPDPLLATTVDAAHIMTAAVWVTGILTLSQALVWAFVGRGRHAQLRLFAPTLTRFASLAPAAVAAAGLTGVLTTIQALDAWSQLGSSRYGTFLLAKILLFGVILTLGAANHFWLLKRLRVRRPSSTSHAENTAVAVLRVELAVGLILLVVTSVLAGLPRPG